MIFRLFHEVTRTNCYWWSQAGGVTPEEYHAAWNYTRWYLEEHRQVDNLLWVYAPWQPSRYPGKSFVEWTDGGFYPGDENVDIVSFDNYDVDATFTNNPAILQVNLQRELVKAVPSAVVDKILNRFRPLDI